MNYERVIAGIFTGTGSLMAIFIGTTCNKPDLVTGGLVLLSGMMAFFVGEKNGAKKANA